MHPASADALLAPWSPERLPFPRQLWNQGAFFWDTTVEKQQIIVKGNPVDGLYFIGPFDTSEEAIDYAENNDSDWWIADLNPPEE